MAKITRCDSCKKLSDETNAGFIGRKWNLIKYNRTLATIEFTEDTCRECVKKLVNEHGLSEWSDD